MDDLNAEPTIPLSCQLFSGGVPVAALPITDRPAGHQPFRWHGPRPQWPAGKRGRVDPDRQPDRQRQDRHGPADRHVPCRSSSGVRIGWVAMCRNLLAQAGPRTRAAVGVNVDIVHLHVRQATRRGAGPAGRRRGPARRGPEHGSPAPGRRPRWTLGLSATRSAPTASSSASTDHPRRRHPHLIQDGYLSPYHHYTIPVYEPQRVAETYARLVAMGKIADFFHRHAECRACWRRLRELGSGAEAG